MEQIRTRCWDMCDSALQNIRKKRSTSSYFSSSGVQQMFALMEQNFKPELNALTWKSKKRKERNQRKVGEMYVPMRHARSTS